MRLSDFIEDQLPAILDEWEAFAGGLLPAAAGMDATGLRDHAEQMLQAIAADLRTPQTPSAQAAKAQGRQMHARETYPRTAAELHAVLRADKGFSIEQLVSEYRALRASVLRLYGDAHPPGAHTIADIGRFNEAVDQAIAESVTYFAAEVEHARQVFLATLAHDLRGPLDAILLTTRVVARLATDASIDAATQRLMRSGERMRDLLDDLLDYNRTRLGLGLPVARQPGDLAAICADELELRRAAHPLAEIRYQAPDALSGVWDASRIRQVLGNLVANAVKYGAPGEPVDVVLSADEVEARLAVRNRGETLPPDVQASMFEPLRRASGDPGDDGRRHLGLGLFVVREIARAHGGHATVDSRDGTTVFTVHLPRGAAP